MEKNPVLNRRYFVQEITLIPNKMKTVSHNQQNSESKSTSFLLDNSLFVEIAVDIFYIVLLICCFDLIIS
jgi:hypothetical protein